MFLRIWCVRVEVSLLFRGPRTKLNPDRFRFFLGRLHLQKPTIWNRRPFPQNEADNRFYSWPSNVLSDRFRSRLFVYLSAEQEIA